MKIKNIPEDFYNETIKVSNQYNVDPYLLLAIAKHETDYGRLGAGRDGFSLGYGYYAPGVYDSKYQDKAGEYTKQLTHAAKQIAAWFQGKPVTESNLKNFMYESWKPGDKSWYQKVWSYYRTFNAGVGDFSIMSMVNEESDGGLTSKKRSLPEKITYIIALLLLVVLIIFFFNKIFR